MGEDIETPSESEVRQLKALTRGDMLLNVPKLSAVKRPELGAPPRVARLTHRQLLWLRFTSIWYALLRFFFVGLATEMVFRILLNGLPWLARVVSGSAPSSEQPPLPAHGWAAYVALAVTLAALLSFLRKVGLAFFINFEDEPYISLEWARRWMPPWVDLEEEDVRD